ncbi:hydroxylamine reductase [Olsenella uli]|uniref:hydroxylamine reductase n=1 Tax=Olsenella uli TaxID=133926 RepID=UPI0028E961A3|nr:hydroxylamine reductase [Olsenella uli]
MVEATLTPERVQQMFCFQCEQTARGTGCTGKQGVCGKSAEVAGLEDQLTGAMIALSQGIVAGAAATAASDRAVTRGLFTCITNVDFDPASVQAAIDHVHAVKTAIAPFDTTPDFDMDALWNEGDEDVRSLKSLVLFGIRGTAAYAYHAAALGRSSRKVFDFFYKALAAIGSDTAADDLLALVDEAGAVNLDCMAMLDEANTGTYGTPVPTIVPLTVEDGPFIVVTGHDLKDLEELLDQTDGTGVNVYTHGEMLPAHAYPELKRHPQLKGNFGTAWQNQQREFDNLPAPILWTTNCLMPPRKSYADRVWTTGVVDFPGCAHIDDTKGGAKDFSGVIAQAKRLGGYAEAQEFTGINGGHEVTCGFGHGSVLGVADKVIDAVKSGEIRHIFLVGGCDGAKPGRNYYTDFVKATPANSLVLTLACGKFRFNDLDLGTVVGLPRILDMGQCNDAYSAIQVAVALAKAFDCSVNELPLSIVLSWYEQKAVCVLLTLLHLGINGIKLGPSLPAFVSPGVLDVLVKSYDIAPAGTVEDDLAGCLA